MDTPGAYEAAETAITRGDLEILYVHTTLEEAAATGDPERRTRLLLVLSQLGKPVVSRGFILGVSRLTHAALTDDDGAQELDALASSNLPKHSRDALAAATARGENCALLTNVVRLTKRATDLGVETLNTDQLLAELGIES